MRYVCITTDCGCKAIGLAKLADREILDNANADRIAKARKPVAITAVGRYVDRKAPALTRKLTATLATQGKRVAAKVSAAYGRRLAKAESDRTDIIRSIIESINAEDLSSFLTDDLETAMLAAFRQAARSAVIQVGISDSPDMVHQLDIRAREYAQERGGELIKDLAGTTMDDMRSLLSRAVDEGMSTDELSSQIEEMGAFGEVRAEMIARTELAYAHVQGNVGGWEETGEVAATRWILGDMHDVPDVCDDCVEAGVRPMGDEFAEGVDYPPAHPNACFEGTLFASYGQIHQLVRSHYSGPAVTLEAERVDGIIEPLPGDAAHLPDGGDWFTSVKKFGSFFKLLFGNDARSARTVVPHRVVVTIGPNHPMLTARGFVRSADLREGDELVYDSRCQLAAVGAVKSDFEQVMRFEDAFRSLSAVFGNTVVAAAAHYFHGDQAFIYGEVDAIRPTRELLNVLDPCGIEQLAELDLVGANTNTIGMPGQRSFFESLWSILASACSFIRCSRDRLPLFKRHVSISGFHRFRVVSTHAHTFNGYAFDASTEHRIYNAGGFVVKNCICDVVPILKSEE